MLYYISLPADVVNGTKWVYYYFPHTKYATLTFAKTAKVTLPHITMTVDIGTMLYKTPTEPWRVID